MIMWIDLSLLYVIVGMCIALFWEVEINGKAIQTWVQVILWLPMLMRDLAAYMVVHVYDLYWAWRLHRAIRRVEQIQRNNE